jgi:hypothetical protein
MTRKNILVGIFSFVMLAMLIVTTWASSRESVLAGGRKLLAEPWGIATLFDCYFAFLTFYLWVFYRELSTLRRALWLIAILLLGNIAMALYVLLALRKLKPGESLTALLVPRRESA